DIELDLREYRLYCLGNPRRQSTTAAVDENSIGHRTHIFDLLANFDAAGALPGNDVIVVEGRHKCQTALLDERPPHFGSILRLWIVESDFGVPPAAILHFDLCSRVRKYNNGRSTDGACGSGDSMPMIARRICKHALAARRFIQQQHLV